MTAEAIEHNPIVYELLNDANAFPFPSSSFGAKAFRLVAARVQPMWDVVEIMFYADAKCVFEIRGGVPISSGHTEHAGFGHAEAFDDSLATAWGGRADTMGSTWIGKEWRTKQIVQCIKVRQSVEHRALQVYIEALTPSEKWTTLAAQLLDHGGETTITMDAPYQGLQKKDLGEVIIDEKGMAHFERVNDGAERYISRLPTTRTFNAIRVVGGTQDGQRAKMWDVVNLRFYRVGCDAARAMQGAEHKADERKLQIQHKPAATINSAHFGSDGKHANTSPLADDDPGYGPQNALLTDAGIFWGGRPEPQEQGGAIWLGAVFDDIVAVKCVMVETPEHGQLVDSVRVQGGKMRAQGPKGREGQMRPLSPTQWVGIGEHSRADGEHKHWIDVRDHSLEANEVASQSGYTRIDLRAWLPMYVERRYGGRSHMAEIAWENLASAAYTNW
jgi:hypothetical protein